MAARPPKARSPHRLKPLDRAAPDVPPMNLRAGGDVPQMSLGRARLELGPLLSSSALETIAESRRRSSNDMYNRWLDAKRDTPLPSIRMRTSTIPVATFDTRPDDMRRRRAMSMDAFNKWCAQKDMARVEHLLLEEERLARKREVERQAAQQDLELEARLLGETHMQLRRETNQALRQDLALHGLDHIVPEDESEEVAIAVLDLRMAIEDAVARGPERRPAHPPVPNMH